MGRITVSVTSYRLDYWGFQRFTELRSIVQDLFTTSSTTIEDSSIGILRMMNTATQRTELDYLKQLLKGGI